MSRDVLYAVLPALILAVAFRLAYFAFEAIVGDREEDDT